MAKLKNRSRLLSLRPTVAFVVLGLGISMFLAQGASAATADDENALLFNPFTLRVVPAVFRARPGLVGRAAVVRGAPVVIADAVVVAAPVVAAPVVVADAVVVAAVRGAGGLVPMGYVPPPRIPYRPPLRSPFRPPM